jgi:hypothetical protein
LAERETKSALFFENLYQFDNTLPDAGAGRIVASAQHFAVSPREMPEDL